MQSSSRPEGRWHLLMLVFGVLLVTGCHRGGSTKNQEHHDAGPRIVSLAPSVTEMIFAI